MMNKAPKPKIIQRFTASIISTLLQIVQILNWIVKICFATKNKPKVLYKELHRIAKLGVSEEVQEFLIKNSKQSSVEGYLFSEFLDLPEIHPYLCEILQGANICLEGDKGFFCDRWSKYPNSYQRRSSHKYQKNKCYGIGYLLFWLDPNGNTRFQFENSPLKGIFLSFNHLVDYLKYCRDNEQQGITGTSKYTEDYCLRLKICPLKFCARKNISAFF